MTQRILILSHDNKIGDAIVATGLFKPLRAHWPDCEIGVLCGGTNAALYRHHPDVKWLHVSNSRNVFARMWASLKARLVGYDMVVHFGKNITNPSEQIVLNIVHAKQRFLFARLPSTPRPNDVVMDEALTSSHYSARHVRFLQALQVPQGAYHYDIRLAPTLEAVKPEGCASLLVLNSQGSTMDRSLPLAWVVAFASEIRAGFAGTCLQVLSASPAHEVALKQALSGFGAHVVVTPFHASVSPSLRVIRAADVVVTPDTYAVHAASAWNIPVVALYAANGPVSVWTPLSDTYVQIEAPPGKIVADIAVSDVIDALHHMKASPQSCRHIRLT